jgi:hypothetical protein
MPEDHEWTAVVVYCLLVVWVVLGWWCFLTARQNIIAAQILSSPGDSPEPGDLSGDSPPPPWPYPQECESPPSYEEGLTP